MNLQRSLQFKTPKQDKSSLDQLAQMKEYLKKQVQKLTVENFDLKEKCKGLKQLQEKIQIWEKENQNLLSENQKLSKYLNHNKLENQQLKQRFQVMYDQRIRQFEINQKVMVKQIERLEDKLAEENTFKSTSLEEIKLQYQIQIKNIKKKSLTSQQNYQSQIRRLRQQIQKRNVEIMQNANKLKTINIERQYQMVKLKQDKERLKNQLAFSQYDKIKQLQEMRSKLQTNYKNQVEQMKKVYMIGEEQIHKEYDKMKQQLEEKNRELESINNKANRQKNYYQDSINYLKKDCQNYRIRIIQTEQFNSAEIHELKQRMSSMHQLQIQQIIFKHQLEIKSLMEQNKKLYDTVNVKNDQIQVLIREKMAIRSNSDKDIMSIKDEYKNILQKFEGLTIKSTEQINESSKRLIEKEKHIVYLSDLLKNIKSTNQGQKSNFKAQIQFLKEENSKEKQLFSIKDKELKEEILSLNDLLNKMKKQFDKTQKQHLKKINDLQNELNGTSLELHGKANSINSKYAQLHADYQLLRKKLSQKEEYINHLTERLTLSEEIETNLQKQVIKIRENSISRQKINSENLLEFKNKLEQVYKAQFEHLKQHQESLLRQKQQKIEKLEQRLENKENELEKLLRDYEFFIREVNNMIEQQANKKQIDIKFSGAGGKLIQIKNQFDCFLKRRLIYASRDILQ